MSNQGNIVNGFGGEGAAGEQRYLQNVRSVIGWVAGDDPEQILSMYPPDAAGSGKPDTGSCIATGLQSMFPGAAASTGSPLAEVGGHWNFPVNLQFSSQGNATNFTFAYGVASQGFSPPARFGTGPAIHLENLGQMSSSNGVYSVSGTAHIDLFNPNPVSLGGGGFTGILGHSFVDYIWGHLVQFAGGNIDPQTCPF